MKLKALCFLALVLAATVLVSSAATETSDDAKKYTKEAGIVTAKYQAADYGRGGWGEGGRGGEGGWGEGGRGGGGRGGGGWGGGGRGGGGRGGGGRGGGGWGGGGRCTHCTTEEAHEWARGGKP